MSDGEADSRTYSLRAVLAEEGTPHACARRIGELVEKTFTKSGVKFELPIFSEDRPGFLRWSWQKPYFPVWVQVVDDRESNVRWITLQGAESARVDRFAQELLADLRVKSLDQLISEATPDQPTSYTRLALGVNGGQRADIVQILASALADPNPETRARSAEGIFILNWHAFRPHVELAENRETDPGVKRAMAAWLRNDSAADP